MADDPFAKYADPFAAFVTKPAAPATRKPVSEDEPGTFREGFIKSIKDQAVAALRPLAKGALDTLPAAGAIIGGALSTPETLGAGTIPGIALGAGVGRGARDLIGHATGLDEPTSPLSKAARIGGETVLAGGTAAVLPGAVAAAKAPIQTLREGAEQFGSAMPPWVRRLGKLFPSLPAKTEPMLTRPPWQTWPSAQPVTGPTAVPKSAAPTGPWSADELAGFKAQGLPQETIDKLAVQMGRAKPTTTPFQRITAQAAPTLEPTAPAPNAADVPFTQPAHPLQGPRMETGAERVGKPLGMSKEQVREVAGPVLGETPGSASPILPKQALQKIIDDMRALPKDGPERAAYVARATSGKTQWQVENIRRTLEHLGLVVPAAVGAREAMTSQLDQR